jgi:uncharacterized protein
MSTASPPPVADRVVSIGWGPRRLHHPILAAVIAFVVGMFAAAMGAGLGIRHLTTTGLTVISVLGLALLLAGLALLGFAGVVAWRATLRWHRLWFIPIAVMALLVMSSVATGAMLAYAPRTSLGAATPADRGLAFSSVTFRTSDGVQLSAWYVPSTNSAAIVTLPGSGSNRTATFGQATVLGRRGYGVLMVDPRGQGRSGGHAMDAGWYGDRDITAAVTFLQHQSGVAASRIGVLGLSMGGEQAIGAAAADPAIRAVVAEGATHRTAADKAGYLPGGVTGTIQRVLDKLTYGTAALLSPAPQPGPLHTAIARAHATRFLLIAAGQGVDEPQAVAYLRTAAPDRVQTWTVPGASHVHALATAPDQWTTRVIGFLDQALGRTR